MKQDPLFRGIKEDSYILGIWSAPIPQTIRKGDLSLICFRDAESEKWKINFRFRYHLTKGPFDGQDEFSCYKAELTCGEEEAIERTRDFFHLYDAVIEAGKGEECLIQGDFQKFAKIMADDKTRPSFMHVMIKQSVDEQFAE